MKELTPYKFDPLTATQLCMPTANTYGLDLTDTNYIVFETSKLRFVVIGFESTIQYQNLMATVKVGLNPHKDEYTHIQKIDLYYHEQVETYVRTAATYLKISVDEIKKGICLLRERLERYKRDLIKNGGNETQSVVVSEAEQTEAMEILRVGNVIECIEGLLKQAGIPTEKENALRLYMILLSRNFDKPLHALLQGSKELSRMLMDALASIQPPEDIHEHTSMSVGSLYYTRGKDYWKNKVLYLPSIDKSLKAASTLKEFIENQQLKRYTTESDYRTRQLYASDKTVEGAICLMAFSDDDSMNAKYFDECFILRVEENQKNTAEMLTHLRKQSSGLLDARGQEMARRTLMTIGRNLKPVRVIIPFAGSICLPEGINQPLKSFNQLITFIQTVALLHQHQLKKHYDSEGQVYIEAKPEHLQIALELMKSIIITQTDRLNPSQRSLLEQLKVLVGDAEKSFTIADALKAVRMSRTSFYRELIVLKELGYVICSGGNKKKGIEYRISNWNDFSQLKEKTDVLDTQLKEIQASFPAGKEVSHKNPIRIPKVEKSLKAIRNKDLRASDG